ncbi:MULTISPECIES: isocitrate lyase/PEP mutase family protein [Niastella]|uniref:Isocitrate lyase/phosphoenolpyruvate mutase family protein n=1 Tax=Niastella soli TaxID=2821487 RepID=A0ABS3YZQ0_9BACT|nr:isocitrate lyase/phosphoenolpyruvate mutase family protein [Niastella soli]MBO9203404.1 isocitrate lyase/phosphoenolpyruvate mutase family protein [Niastella soli]
MPSLFQQFKELHRSLFIIPNAWNPKSALHFQQQHFPAVATSSAAVANSLGYEDGEAMPFDEYLFIVRRILATVQVPVTIDIEMGYGKTNEAIYANIRKLAALGVAGINIEDSTIQSAKRTLRDANSFAQTIDFIKTKLAQDQLELFINVRCDTYILDVANKQSETAKRLELYEAAGADGIFLPCISAETDIAEAVNSTTLPINVMCIPGLPDIETLKTLGVKRASMGPFLFNRLYEGISTLTEAITATGSFAPLFA